MKKTLLTLAGMIMIYYAHAQVIGGGMAPTINDLTIPLSSGVYSAAVANGAPTGSIPDHSYYAAFQHVLNIRHGNPENLFQLQLSSSFSMNDRLFFRKIGGTLTPQNPDWHEVATRAHNNFTGNQVIAGTVSIGSQALAPQQYKLAVAGKAIMEELKIKSPASSWPDYVFTPLYQLMPLNKVEAFIKTNGHLPEVPSAKEVKEKGIEVGANQALLLKKIEELTLYMIEQKKENEALKSEVKELKKLILTTINRRG